MNKIKNNLWALAGLPTRHPSGSPVLGVPPWAGPTGKGATLRGLLQRVLALVCSRKKRWGVGVGRGGGRGRLWAR